MDEILCPKCGEQLHAKVAVVVDQAPLYRGGKGHPTISTVEGEVLLVDYQEIFCPGCGAVFSPDEVKVE